MFTLSQKSQTTLRDLLAPASVVAEGGRVAGLSCTRMRLGERDASGRPRPVLVQGVRERVTLAGPEAGESNAPDAVPPARQSELVFIGYHASRARVAGLLSTITATHWS